MAGTEFSSKKQMLQNKYFCIGENFGLREGGVGGSLSEIEPNCGVRGRLRAGEYGIVLNPIPAPS